MRTIAWIAVCALVACRSSGGGAPGDGERSFWQCPAGQVFYMEYTPVPSTQAPLFVSGRDEPDQRAACEPLRTGSRYRVEAWGKVNYYSPTQHLEFGPNGTGKPAAAPPFTRTHGPLAGRAAEFSLIYSLDGAMWEHSGEAHAVELIGHDQSVCFAAHDIKGGYGDNAGFYAVTLHEERLDFGCRAKPIDGGVGGGTGGPLCGKPCTTDQRGVCSAGLWACPDGGRGRVRRAWRRRPTTTATGSTTTATGSTTTATARPTRASSARPARRTWPARRASSRPATRSASRAARGAWPAPASTTATAATSTRGCPARSTAASARRGRARRPTRCIPGFLCKLGATPGCGTPSTGTECWPTGVAACEGCAGLRCWMPKDVTLTGVCP